MTSNNREQFGILKKTNNGLDIVLMTQERDNVTKYMHEMLNGDYTPKNEVVEISKMMGKTFRDCTISPEKFSLLLDFMQKYRELEIYKLPNSNFQILVGGKVMNPESARLVYRTFVERFTYVANQFRFVSPMTINQHTFTDRALFSRFHTHPLNDENPQPSNPDKANTFIGGPSILFSQTNGRVLVYAINRGNASQIYSFEAK